MTKAIIVPDNKIDVLQNGDGFYPALLESIATAKETINFETYVWWSGGICEEVAEAFAKRAREGVEVRVMIDALGSMKMSRKLRKLMEDAGCKVARYHPIRLVDLGQLNKRTHRKLAIFDGKVAYIFGHGISRLWTGNGQDKDHWRDTGVRIQGPVVNGVAVGLRPALDGGDAGGDGRRAVLPTPDGGGPDAGCTCWPARRSAASRTSR